MLYPLISYVHKNIGFQCQNIFLYLCIDFLGIEIYMLDLTIKNSYVVQRKGILIFFDAAASGCHYLTLKCLCIYYSFIIGKYIGS